VSSANLLIRGLESLCCVGRLGELGLFSLEREGCGETLEQLPVPGGAARELERGWNKGME